MARRLVNKIATPQTQITHNTINKHTHTHNLTKTQQQKHNNNNNQQTHTQHNKPQQRTKNAGCIFAEGRERKGWCSKTVNK